MKRAKKVGKNGKPATNPAGPPREYHFKKGHTINPAGRPKATPEQKRAKELMLKHFPKYAIDIMTKPSHELMERLKDTNTPPGERLFLGAVFKGIKDGNIDVLLKIMNRICGNAPIVPDETLYPGMINIGPTPGLGTGIDDGDNTPRVVVYIPSNGREVRDLLVDET